MEHVLNVATIMICTGVMTLVVAMALTFMWIFERREKAVGWWCASMWTATIASILLASRPVAPWWLAIGLGNAAVLLAYGLIWAGFVAFSGRKTNRGAIVLGAAWTLIAIFGFSVVRADINNRVIVISIGISFYCLMVARTTWSGWKAERLPTLFAASIFYSTHALFYVIRIPLSLFWPLKESIGPDSSTWYAFVVLESFVHGMFTSFVFLALIRERAERRYRLAAEIDSLTSAASRRYFVAETRKILERKPKSGVLAVLDLDFFKRVNDSYGHMAGDKVLRSFGHHMTSALAPGMLFGRLGGEEFGLYLPDISADQAANTLETVRLGIENLDIVFMGGLLKITASIGAAAIDEAGCDFDHLMAAADNALYLAKDEGRNQVKFFHPTFRIRKIIEAGRDSRVSLSIKRVSRLNVRSHSNRG